jgi:hypothetical protein
LATRSFLKIISNGDYVTRNENPIYKESVNVPDSLSLEWENCFQQSEELTWDIVAKEPEALLQPRVRSLKMHCLVDCDPFGLDIFFTYKYGSRAMHYHNLDCPEIQWMGVHPSSISDSTKNLTLTLRDRLKLLNLFQRTSSAFIRWIF